MEKDIQKVLKNVNNKPVADLEHQRAVFLGEEREHYKKKKKKQASPKSPKISEKIFNNICEIITSKYLKSFSRFLQDYTLLS